MAQRGTARHSTPPQRARARMARHTSALPECQLPSVSRCRLRAAVRSAAGWEACTPRTCTTASLSASSALVASSSSSTAGRRTSARAMAIRCFCPPLSCTPFSPHSVS